MEKKTRYSKKLKIKKKDTVLVIAGNDKGKKGEVRSVDYEKSRIIVDDVNIRTKHSKPTQENPDGGIIKEPASIHISNVMLIDPKTNEPTRVGRQRDDKGKLVRVSKKSGEEID